LTPEEKEKLREKRKELEHQRRQRYEQEKLERKQALWASNNYESKNLEFPTDDHGNALSPGRIFNVLGDVTKPQRSLTDTSKNALIVQCVDDGGLDLSSIHFL
jgi:hypothetical protein